MIQIDDHHGGRIRLSESGVSLYRRRELTRDIEWQKISFILPADTSSNDLITQNIVEKNINSKVNTDVELVRRCNVISVLVTPFVLVLGIFIFGTLGSLISPMIGFGVGVAIFLVPWLYLYIISMFSLSGYLWALLFGMKPSFGKKIPLVSSYLQLKNYLRDVIEEYFGEKIRPKAKYDNSLIFFGEEFVFHPNTVDTKDVVDLILITLEVYKRGKL